MSVPSAGHDVLKNPGPENQAFNIRVKTFFDRGEVVASMVKTQNCLQTGCFTADTYGHFIEGHNLGT